MNRGIAGISLSKNAGKGARARVGVFHAAGRSSTADASSNVIHYQNLSLTVTQ